MSKFYQPLWGFTFLIVSFLNFKGSFAATDVVTNTATSGAGSLAAAIVSSNTRPGLDTIVFAIPPNQAIFIRPNAALPTITDALFINGYSESGALAGPIASRIIRINIDGTFMVGGPDLFTINADNVTIAGLAIYRSLGYGVRVLNGADNIFIWGNYVGTDSTGTSTTNGNRTGGIVINENGVTPNTNIIIGTDGNGTNDYNEGNLISANLNTSAANGDGLLLWQIINSRIAGNIIGFNKNNGGFVFGNRRNGILLTVGSTNNFIGTNSTGDGADSAEANLIGANFARGILVAGGSNANVIAGNFVGLDQFNGIEILNSSNNRIGTDGNGVADALERNTSYSNVGGGIVISAQTFVTFNFNSTNNTVAGNMIGTPDSSLAVGNDFGILLYAANDLSVNDNIIGSNFDGNNDQIEGNVIAFNDTGIVATVPGGLSTIRGNKFARNSIYGNQQLGIDLGKDGVTPNDDGDLDTGPNDYYNFPVITSVLIDGSNNLTISGFSRPGSVIEFYIADSTINPNPLPGGFTKSFGEGKIYLFRAQEGGVLNGITDDSATVGTYDGNDEGTGTGGTRTENKFGFTVPVSSLPASVSSGTRITSSAYDIAIGPGNTSEFGGVVAAAVIPVRLISFSGRLNNGKVLLTWTTTEEFNNSHFEVERSSNGNAYAKIGSVNGKGRRDNTYYFTDEGPVSKINYYRLRQVDIDGKFSYTKVLVLRSDLGKINGKISPNPFTNFINLTYWLSKEEKIRIRLFDLSGKAVKTYFAIGNTGINTINLTDLQNIPKGIYTIELDGESVFRQTVIKQ